MICRSFLFSLLLSSNSFADFYGFHPNSRLYLGGGYDKLSPGKAFVPCLEYDGVKSISGNRPVTSSIEITGIKSSREFHQKVGFSSFLEGSYLFTEGEASVSYNFEKNFSENSFNWLVILKADYGNFILERARLSDQFKHLDVEWLVERCGREFVIEEKRSIMVFALLSMKNIEENQRKELEAKLSVASRGLVFDVSFGAAYKNFMSKASSLGEISIKLYSYGGGGLSDFKDLLGLEAFMNYRTVLSTFKSVISKMRAEDASPSVYMTTGLESFSKHRVSQFGFQKVVLIDLYYSYQNLISDLEEMKFLIKELKVTGEDSRDFSGDREMAYKTLSKIEERAKACFDKDNKTLCRHLDPELNFSLKSRVRWLICEKKRQKSLMDGIINQEFYDLAKRRDLIPTVENGKLQGWLSCRM